MSVNTRRLKVIQFAVGDPAVNFECQITSWTVNNNTPDGDRKFTYCTDQANAAVIEDTDPDWSIDLTFYSDWRSDGISEFLQTNDGADAAFTLDHHPDITGEHVQWAGFVRIKAPNVGGDARTTESQQVTLRCLDKPVYTRIG